MIHIGYVEAVSCAGRENRRESSHGNFFVGERMADTTIKIFPTYFSRITTTNCSALGGICI